jgi:glucosamine-6-phosphate deaminase
MITIANTEQEFDILAASRVIDQITASPKSVIGLSTGRTTGNMHRIIAERQKKE